MPLSQYLGNTVSGPKNANLPPDGSEVGADEEAVVAERESLDVAGAEAAADEVAVNHEHAWRDCPGR